MVNREEKSCDDLYAVLGLNKECTATELRTAYKKLALRWHPDRCSASGNSEFVEEAKKKFQAIQQAYSVLSDASRRFMYDAGAYDSDDDENGMGDFLNEMAVMMSQTKPSENAEESFEQLQELFDEMLQGDIGSFGSSSQPSTSCSSSPFHGSCNVIFDLNNNQHHESEMTSGTIKIDDSSGFEARVHNFSLGMQQTGWINYTAYASLESVEHQQDFKKGKGARGGGRGGANSSRRLGRKQKVSASGHDVSSN